MDKIIDNTTGFHFTIIDNYILNCAGLNAFEQIVYIHLKMYVSESNKCFPGINKLAEAVSLSQNTVRKILKSLKEKGFVDIQQRFNTSNEYTLLPYPEYVEEINGSDAAEEETEGISTVLQSYGNNINPLFGSMEREKLLNWYNAFEENGDILLKAIEIAVLQGVRKMKYIESILLSWHQSGIRSLEQRIDEQREWDKKRRYSKNESRDSSKDKDGDSEERYDFSKYSSV